MFNISGDKKYKVSRVFGGSSEKTAYTFITVEDKVKEGLKFPERLKINVWGTNIADKINEGDAITVVGAREVGIETYTKENKTYKTLVISCSPDDIVVCGKFEEEKPKQEEPTTLQPIEDEDLPF